MLIIVAGVVSRLVRFELDSPRRVAGILESVRERYHLDASVADAAEVASITCACARALLGAPVGALILSSIERRALDPIDDVGADVECVLVEVYATPSVPSTCARAPWLWTLARPSSRHRAR